MKLIGLILSLVTVAAMASDSYVVKDGTSYLNGTDGKLYPVVLDLTTTGNGMPSFPLTIKNGTNYLNGIPVVLHSTANGSSFQPAGAPIPSVTTNYYVDMGGVDSIVCGAVTSPCRTIKWAQSAFNDEKVNTGIGPAFNKQYTIYIGPGQYLEDPSFVWKQYVNYVGVSKKLTFVSRSDFSTIDYHYGDNYGFAQVWQGLHISGFSLTRTAGFTDPTNLPTETDFIIKDCELEDAFVQGSGYDQGFPLFVLENVTLDHTSSNNLEFHGIQLSDFFSTHFNVIVDSDGVDQASPLGGGYVHRTSQSDTHRYDLRNYSGMEGKASRVAQVRLRAPVFDPYNTGSFGQQPSYTGDVTSQPGLYQFFGGATTAQIGYTSAHSQLSNTYREAVVTSSPFVCADSQKLFVNLDTPGATSITLCDGGGNQDQEVFDYAGDAGTNNITVTAGRFDRFKGGGTTSVINTNNGHQRYVWTPLGSDPGAAQDIHIQAVADVSKSLAGSNYTVCAVTSGIQTSCYQLWHKVLPSFGSAPSPTPGVPQFEVDINENDTADAVAAADLAVLQFVQTGREPGELMNCSSFASDTIDCTNYVNGATTGPTDGTPATGFTFSTITPGVDPIFGTFIVQ